MGFAHLHVHSEYSLLDGACRIGPLIERAKELGQTALAITDHGVAQAFPEALHAQEGKQKDIIGDMKIIYAKPDDKRIGLFKMRYGIRNANCSHPAAALASLCHYNAFVCISCKCCFVNVIKNMLWILCLVIYL